MSASFNVNSDNKSYSLSYSKAFFKPIVTDAKYSSVKTEGFLPLEDVLWSDGAVRSSRI